MIKELVNDPKGWWIFVFTKTDLMEMRATWDNLKETWNHSNGIKEVKRKEYEIDREIIEDFLDGYVSYLDNKNQHTTMHINHASRVEDNYQFGLPARFICER